MKAMIFAAGLGTRLKPFTLEHPKALVPVGGVPMLQRVILRLKAVGVDEMVVNVHHFADQIVDFLRNHDDFGVKVHISDETSLLLDTGGGLLAAKRWLEDGDAPFIVHNADILTDFDLAEMVTQNLHTGSLASLLVAARETKRYLLFDDDMQMQGWTNITTGQVKPQGLDTISLHRYAFGGVHVMRPQIFDALEAYAEPGTVFSITDFYIDMCSDLKFSGFVPSQSYYWHDIGKIDTLAEAQQHLGKN